MPKPARAITDAVWYVMLAPAMLGGPFACKQIVGLRHFSTSVFVRAPRQSTRCSIVFHDAPCALRCQGVVCVRVRARSWCAALDARAGSSRTAAAFGRFVYRGA